MLICGVAGRLLALQFALGLRAVGGLGALVLAGELLADGSALRLGRRTGGVATCRLADRLALGAVILLTLILGAANRADGLLAMDGALGARHLLALHLALRTLANGVAHSRAGRVIALPFADRVALLTQHAGQGRDGQNRYEHLVHGDRVVVARRGRRGRG